jgi:hypothetical protein
MHQCESNMGPFMADLHVAYLPNAERTGGQIRVVRGDEVVELFDYVHKGAPGWTRQNLRQVETHYRRRGIELERPVIYSLDPAYAMAEALRVALIAQLQDRRVALHEAGGE